MSSPIENLNKEVYQHLSQVLSTDDLSALSQCSKTLNTKYTNLFFQRLPSYLHFYTISTHKISANAEDGQQEVVFKTKEELKQEIRSAMERLIAVGTRFFSLDFTKAEDVSQGTQNQTTPPSVEACVEIQQKILDSLDDPTQCEHLLSVSCDELGFYGSLLASSCTKIASFDEVPTDLYTPVDHAIDMHARVFFACHATGNSPSLKEAAWQTLPLQLRQTFIERLIGQLHHSQANVGSLNSTHLESLYEKTIPIDASEQQKETQKTHIRSTAIADAVFDRALEDSSFIFGVGVKEGLLFFKKLREKNAAPQLNENKLEQACFTFNEIMTEKFINNNPHAADIAGKKLLTQLDDFENLLQTFENMSL